MSGGRGRKGGLGGGNRYLQRFLNSKEKAAQQSCNSDNENVKASDNEDIKASDASELFERTISKATPADILSEYTWFLKNMPQLIEAARSELIEKVKTHLKIDAVQQTLAHGGDMADMNQRGGYPILDALSVKLRLSLRTILCPPTIQCLLCDKDLQRNHKPALVPFHTEEGAMLATKFSWECRRCRSTYKFRNVIENKSRVFYNVDNYGSQEMGFKAYPVRYNVKAFRASEMEYFSKKYLESYLARLQHSFVSSEGECEAYNDVHRNSPEAREKREFFEKFLQYNPSVGHHFQSEVKIAESEMIGGEDLEEEEEEEKDDDDEEEEKEPESKKQRKDCKLVRSTMHQLTKLSLREAYYEHEVYSEMAERGQVESEIFGPYMDPSNPSVKISRKQSVDAYMRKIDNLRRNELYKHDEEDCSEGCRRRGCGTVASVDGNWKVVDRPTQLICISDFP